MDRGSHPSGALSELPRPFCFLAIRTTARNPLAKNNRVGMDTDRVESPYKTYFLHVTVLLTVPSVNIAP